jgi:hypothetical protein
LGVFQACNALRFDKPTFISEQRSDREWLAYDFKRHRIRQVGHIIQSRNDDPGWDNSNTITCEFQASNDPNPSYEAKQRMTLSAHGKVVGMMGRRFRRSFACPFTANAFRYFRIVQTGVNANGDRHLALGGFDILGDILGG